MKRAILSFLIMFLIAIFFGFGFYIFTSLKFPIQKKNEKIDVILPLTDVDGDSDIVRVLILFHAADYFVYKGVPIGFQYEMLKQLEKELGRNIDIKVEAEVCNIKKQLREKSYDIVVMDLKPSRFILPHFERSIPHSYSYPVLVSGIKADTKNVQTILVSNDLSAIIFFTQESNYCRYHVERCNDFTSEELFEKVDNGEVPYLICDYNQAITLMPFYSNVKILEKAGPQFERRWLLNNKNVQLNEEINQWLFGFKQTAKYSKLLQKYFSIESSLINASFANKQKNGISQFDAIVQKYAQQYNLDWRFVSSIIYQETKFISGLTGKGGSYGLMQLMPVTMDYYGISEDDDDEANIRVGIQHINSIRKSFDDIENEEEKLYFVAAAYNAGRGHIFDAQRLCAKYEENFNNWNDVSKYLILKARREYANDSVVKSGFFPGAYTVNYAYQVMSRYSAYKAAFTKM
ncbi:MAG: transglycosylase SLT domain-containing protein [Bacteroidales bacterium]|nr:transglycosylase SLT domain-containing protein [Bacteroidales bacterium]